MYKTVAEYIKNAPSLHRPQLNAVRRIIQKTVPDVVEGIAYGMPAYRYNDKPLLYFAAMKGHLGLYPTSGPIRALKNKLNDFSTSKGCIRVPWTQKVPERIIVKLLQARMREIEG